MENYHRVHLAGRCGIRINDVLLEYARERLGQLRFDQQMPVEHFRSKQAPSCLQHRKMTAIGNGKTHPEPNEGINRHHRINFRQQIFEPCAGQRRSKDSRLQVAIRLPEYHQVFLAEPVDLV